MYLSTKVLDIHNVMYLTTLTILITIVDELAIVKFQLSLVKSVN